MPIPQDLLDQIPPLARHERVPLSAEENAFDVWHKAAQRLVANNDPRIVDYLESDDTAFPGGKLGAMLREWLDANAAAIELFRSGVRRRGWQLPEIDVGVDFDGVLSMDHITDLRRFAHLVHIATRRLAADGRFDEAAELAVDQLRAGQMVCRGDGLRVHYFIGLALLGIGRESIRELAIHRKCPEATLAKLSDVLREAEEWDDGYANAERVEVLYNLAQLANWPDQGSADEIIDFFLTNYYDTEPCMLIDEEEKAAALAEMQADRRLEQRSEDLRFLLEGHPKLWDKHETARLIGDEGARRIARCGKPWSEVVAGDEDREDDATSIWPAQLGPGFPLQCFGPSEAGRRAFDENFQGVYQDWRYPSREELSERRTRLQSVLNPVGQSFANYLFGSDWLFMSFKTRTHSVGLRTVIAICRYRARHGRVPERLEQLVDEQLLDAVPLDPFDGQPLRYCPRREIVWSVGQDGVDDEGHAGGDNCCDPPRDIVTSAQRPGRLREWLSRWRR